MARLSLTTWTGGGPGPLAKAACRQTLAGPALAGITLLLLLFGGCSMAPYRSPGTSPEAPVVSRPAHPPVPATQPQVPPPGTTVPARPVSPEEPAVDASGRQEAVAGLLASARQLQAGGAYGRAAARIEQALEIAPDDAELWHALAQLRLAAGQPGQAAQLAARSNALAGDDPALRSRNEAIIRAAGRAP